MSRTPQSPRPVEELSVTGPIWRAIVASGKGGISSDSLRERFGENVKAHVYWMRKRHGKPISSRRHGVGVMYWASDDLAPPVVAKRPRNVKPEPKIPALDKMRMALEQAAPNPIAAKDLTVVYSKCYAQKLTTLLRLAGQCFMGRLPVKCSPTFYWRYEADMLTQTARPPKVKQKSGPKPKPMPKLTRKVPPQTPPQGEVIVPATAKYTVCPSSRDTRFTASSVTPYFGALTPGSYPPSGTVIGSVYG